MLQSFRNAAHRFFRRCGWEVHRIVSDENAKAQKAVEAEIEKWKFAQRFQAKTVLDIGANTGQFASVIRQVLPAARIISFEPLQQCFDELKNNKKIGPPFEAIQLALGNESGESAINCNEFSPSSSLLTMTTLHVEEFPQTGRVSEQRIRIEPLDCLFDSLAVESPFIVKVDVQGFEEQVLLGGRRSLSMADAIVLEVSAYPLYKGAPTFDDLHAMMRNLGFRFVGNVDQIRSKTDLRILQFDALFESERLQVRKIRNEH